MLLHIQFLPQRKQYEYPLRRSILTLFKDVIAVCYENTAKPTVHAVHVVTTLL